MLYDVLECIAFEHRQHIVWQRFLDIGGHHVRRTYPDMVLRVQNERHEPAKRHFRAFLQRKHDYMYRCLVWILIGIHYAVVQENEIAHLGFQFCYPIGFLSGSSAFSFQCSSAYIFIFNLMVRCRTLLGVLYLFNSYALR